MSNTEEYEFGSEERVLHSHSPLTMAMLFYLVTIGAIISACLRSLVGNVGSSNAPYFWVFSVCAGIGVVCGIGIGLLLFRGGRAAALSPVIGILVGLVAAALSLVRVENFFEITSLAFAGSWLLMVFALVAARFRKS